jgi:hypothetical protein
LIQDSGIDISNVVVGAIYVISANFSETDPCIDVELK